MTSASLEALEERLGIVEEEILFDAVVASVDPLAREIELVNGMVLLVPHDAVIDHSGDYLTLSALAAAVALGASVRAEGEAVEDGGGFRAIEVRFEDGDDNSDPAASTTTKMTTKTMTTMKTTTMKMTTTTMKTTTKTRTTRRGRRRRRDDDEEDEDEDEDDDSGSGGD